MKYLMLYKAIHSFHIFSPFKK